MFCLHHKLQRLGIVFVLDTSYNTLIFWFAHLTSYNVFKVDDDSFVNPKRLWSSLDHALLHTTTRKSLQPFVHGASSQGKFSKVSKQSKLIP